MYFWILEHIQNSKLSFGFFYPIQNKIVVINLN